MGSSEVRAGRAAAVAGVLMAVGTQGEWLLDAQRDDGTITSKPAFVLLLATSTLGFALLTVAVRNLRRRTTVRTRPARTAGVLSVAGAGLLTVFGVAVLVTGVTRGAPLGLSFVFFALGLLLLSVGTVVWGLTLRRSAPATSLLLEAAGAAAFAAVATPADPWHDLALVVLCAAWSAIGVVLLRTRRGAGQRLPGQAAGFGV